MADICDDVNIQNHLTCFPSYYVTLHTEKTDSRYGPQTWGILFPAKI